MKIKITRRLPAPLMDGLDVRAYHPKGVYEVTQQVGEYLIVAGYAAPASARKPGTRKQSRPK